MKFFFSKYNTAFSRFLNKPFPDLHEWLLIIALTVALTLFLYANTLDGYWRFDDGTHLMFATEYSPWQYFFDPAITRAQSGSNVTPWNVFFYDLNLSIFGFEPSGFYSHLLLLIIGSSLALYALLRFWLPLPSAVFGILLFLTGKPTYHLTQELMSNHYLTGMLFSLLCLNFFIHYIRHGNSIKLLFSVVLYALAMTCKEVYVPLIALLFVIPAGIFKQRLRAILPFILVAVGYALWRHEVLGAWIGGYKAADTAKAGYQIVVQQLANIPFLLFNHRGWGLTGLCALIIISLLAVRNRLLNVPLILVSMIFIFVPLVPLTLSQGIGLADRYLFVTWVATSIWIAIIYQANKNGKEGERFLQSEFIAKSLGAIVLITASFLGYMDKSQHRDSIQKAEDIYRFAIESDFSRKALMLDTSDSEYWAFVSSEARRAYDISNGFSSPPILIIVNTLNGLLLLDNMTQEKSIDLSSVQFYHYRNGFSPLNIKPVINSLLKSLNAGKDQVLQVTFSHEKSVLKWAFQPEKIAYSAILWKGKSNLQYPILELPEKGSYPWSITDEIQISLSFKSPEGWIAVTPKLKFTPGEQNLVWQGKTDMTLVTDKLQSLLFASGLNNKEISQSM